MKSKLIKSLSVLVIGSMLIASMLSGCGSKTDNSAAESTAGTETSQATETAAPAAKPVELKVITWRVEDQAFYDTFNEDFQKQYPNITVKYDAVATKDYEQLKTARIAAGEVDVMSAGSTDLMNEASRAQYLDIKDQPFVKNYIEGAFSSCKYNDKLLILPLNSVGFVTFYNKKMFADNGISIPTTWPDFVKVCETFKSKGIDPIIFGGKDQWPVNMVIGQFESAIVRTAQPDFYTKSRTEENKYTDAPWIEVLTKLKQLGQYFQKNSAGLGYGQAPGLFAQGKAAMMIDGTWTGAQITDAKPAFEVGTFLLPASDKAENNKAVPGKIGGGFAINKDSQNIESALKYLDFHSTKENYTKYIEFVKMAPVQNGIALSDPLSQEIATLMSNQIPEWELLLTPGAKYDFTARGMEVLYGKVMPEESAQKLQKEYINSKSEWLQN